MELIIVTGMSGAGKTHAMHCMEDLGYYCIDNMPPKLMDDFVTLAGSDNSEFKKVAFMVDVRGGQFFDDLKQSLEDLHVQGVEYKIMFLEASDAALVRRFKETRRNHPLAPNGNIQDGIREEREKLSFVRSNADYVIDTSDIKVAKLNAEIKRLLSSEDQESFTLLVESFGYKNGMPDEADWVLDARFLPNPFYVPSLKNLTGKNKKIRDYVLACPEAGKFAGRITGQILELIPSYIREGKYHLTVAIGCTGGRHRSVVMASEIAKRLEENVKHCTLIHRDL